jgi:hypothetical protein
MKGIKWFVIALFIIATACSSSKITTSWKAQDVAARKYDKILVLGLIKDNDRSMQERMEQHFVGDLTDMGYSAVSALQVYGPKVFEKLDEKAALEKIKTSGADAVITIVLLDKVKERNYVPPRTFYPGRFWDYYGLRYERINEPGYYVTDTKYFWESNFYDMHREKLLYSVQTRSFSPKNTDALGHEYGLMIVKKMLKEKILTEQKISEE